MFFLPLQPEMVRSWAELRVAARRPEKLVAPAATLAPPAALRELVRGNHPVASALQYQDY